MNRTEFEVLRDLPDKRIEADIFFDLKQPTSPNLTFEDVKVENSLNYDVVLNGTYKPGIPAITFNFVLRGTGPICRVCVEGTLHPGAGRTHKHDLRKESDPRNNLPIAVARADLERRSAKEVWDIVLQQANIRHIGTFTEPESAQ